MGTLKWVDETPNYLRDINVFCGTFEETPKEAKMKYKVGDQVRIKTWKEMKREYGVTPYGSIATGKEATFPSGMEEYCNKVMTISQIKDDMYYMKEDEGYWSWNDNMIKGLATKRAIFYCEKVIRNGKEYIQVNDWENVLRKSELPKEYLSEYPFFCSDFWEPVTERIGCYETFNSNRMHIEGRMDGRLYYIVLEKGDFIPYGEWHKFYNKKGTGILQQAGERLSKILKEKKWHGKFEAKI